MRPYVEELETRDLPAPFGIRLLFPEGGFGPGKVTTIRKAAETWTDLIAEGAGTIEIKCLARSMDGPGGTLAYALEGAWFRRTWLPRNGTIVFDRDDLARTNLRAVALHEMCHNLGFIDTTLWVAGLMTSRYRYIGPHATRVYGQPSIPMDGSHWAEGALGHELMTPYLEGATYISRVTLGALVDLGYRLRERGH